MRPQSAAAERQDRTHVAPCRVVLSQTTRQPLHCGAFINYSAAVLRLHVDPSRFQESDLLPAVRAIHAGGVVAIPTDTLYGLAADPRSPAAVGKIYLLKHRPQDRPVPLIAANVEQVRQGVGTMTPL